MNEGIDESLYSRQLYVMGHVAQRKMASSSVLLCGLGGGLGIETAKNLVLAGVKSVTLYDTQNASYADLAANFYLSEESIGCNRASICAAKLAKLNPYVSVNAIEQKFNTLQDWKDYIKKQSITVLVLANYTDDIDESAVKHEELCDWCHQEGVYVVVGEVRGVFARIFCDFGASFRCDDRSGEVPAQSMVANVTCSAHETDFSKLVLQVTVLEDTRHNLETGDSVKLSDIEGLQELNLNGIESDIRVRDPFTFEMEVDATIPAASVSPYIRGGYVKQVIKPVMVSFKCLSESTARPLADGCSFNGDVVKMHHFGPLHCAFAALHEFRSQKGHFPAPGIVEDAALVFSMAKQHLSTQGHDYGVSTQELADQEDLIQRLANCCRGFISPMCALVGGVMGQEVLKACSGKFMPLTQWFYYDNVEVLPADPLPAHELAPCGCRYDGNIMVFGRSVQSKLHGLNAFLVGAGAIGCEMLKNWAMMGISCEGSSALTAASSSSCGTVYLTDMDRIEKSNLSRQFLFRNTDINCPKSTTAARAVREQMNPAFKVVAYESKVAPDTENFFDDDFFDSLDFVCTALDNVEARLYIDQRCMFYHKPMMESGTLGAKGHTQVVVPFKTENYGASRDPPEKSIPVCTLKHFPNQIDHTLQWAREWFEEMYKQTPEDTNRFLQSVSPEDYSSSLAAQQNMKLDTLQRVKNSLFPWGSGSPVEEGEKPVSFADCVKWARLLFEKMFNDQIRQLLHNFPVDRRTAEGALFWSGAKVPPTALDFDLQDELHKEFVISAALMRAGVYGIPVGPAEESVESVARVFSNLIVPSFRPTEGVTIAVTEEEAKQQKESGRMATTTGADIDEQCNQILRTLQSLPSTPADVLQVVEFDKDIDSHMRVVAAVSNLRARNYRIPEADLHTSRGIAGKITPAIATTTAMVTGAICLELLKVLADKPVTQMSNSFFNLALPLFTSMEPEPPKSTTAVIGGTKAGEWKWTQWDRIDIVDEPNTPTLTVDGLIDLLMERYGVELSMLSTGVTIIYSDFMNRVKMKERKAMTLREVVESVSKKTIPSSQRYCIFEIMVNDLETGDEVELPYLRYRLPPI